MTKMAGARMRRVNEAVREVVSAHIAGDLKDPRIGFVTVTSVDTSPDLRHARVYVSVLGDESDRLQALEGLRSSRGFLQAKLNEELHLKRTPTLAFEYDSSIERGMRVTHLIDEAIAAEPAPADDAAAADEATGPDEAAPTGEVAPADEAAPPDKTSKEPPAMGPPGQERRW
jgi:ribosome-binding factor A